MGNVIGQKINIQTVINKVFCDSTSALDQKVYIIADSTDNVVSYNGNDSTCFKLHVCENEKEFLTYLRKEKKVYIFSFHEINSKTINNNEKIYTLRLSIVNLKGNRKRLNILIHQDSYQVTLRKSVQNSGKWEISKVNYPKRVDSIRSKR